MSKNEIDGFTVGTTRSGKAIYVYLPIDLSHDEIIQKTNSLALEDQFDAFAIFEYLAFREYRKNGDNSKFFTLYESYSMVHRLMFPSNEAFEVHKVAAKITSAFALRDYGRKLVNKEYQDL